MEVMTDCVCFFLGPILHQPPSSDKMTPLNPRGLYLTQLIVIR